MTRSCAVSCRLNDKGLCKRYSTAPNPNNFIDKQQPPLSAFVHCLHTAKHQRAALLMQLVFATSLNRYYVCVCALKNGVNYADGYEAATNI